MGIVEIVRSKIDSSIWIKRLKLDQKMSKVKVGFIGCGDVSELHYQGLKACNQAELVGIYDIDSLKIKKREKEWNVKIYESKEALLNDHEIQAVFILTPLNSHYKDVKAALNSRKHVLVEKPVAEEIFQIEEIARLASSKGLKCMPAHNYIYSPDMLKLKHNILSGNLGSVAVSWFMYHIHHSEELCARYPGIIRQIGTHLLYAHRYLFGTPASMSIQTTNFLYPHLNRCDQMMAILKMPDGSMSNLFASFAVSDFSSNPWTFVVKVLGTGGSTQLSWRDVVFNRALGTLSQSYGRYEDTYEHEIQYFINECILSGMSPLSTLEDACEVLKMELQLEKEMNQNEKK